MFFYLGLAHEDKTIENFAAELVISLTATYHPQTLRELQAIRAGWVAGYFLQGGGARVVARVRGGVRVPR